MISANSRTIGTVNAKWKGTVEAYRRRRRMVGYRLAWAANFSLFSWSIITSAHDIFVLLWAASATALFVFGCLAEDWIRGGDFP